MIKVLVAYMLVGFGFAFSVFMVCVAVTLAFKFDEWLNGL